MIERIAPFYLRMSESRTGERIGQPEFEAFYLRTARVLHGYLCRLSRDSTVADEILQQAYICLINARGLEESPCKAYLYRTATNLLRDRWRKQKREREFWERQNFAEPTRQDLNLSLDVQSVLKELAGEDRAVLWLAHVEQFSHKEIGIILGLKEKSIKVILFRARSRARELFRKAGWRMANEERD